MEVKLHVGNLAPSTTAQGLQQLFSQAGKVSTVNLVADHSTGQFRGFAYLTMATLAGAHRAIGQFHDCMWAGSKLTVRLARPHAAPAGYQSKLGAFRGSADGDAKVRTQKPGQAHGGYQSALSAFGNDKNSPTTSRRRRGGQRQ